MSSSAGSSLLSTDDIEPARLRKQRRRRALPEASPDPARAQLFMSANDPITPIDSDGRYLEVDEAACSTFSVD